VARSLTGMADVPAVMQAAVLGQPGQITVQEKRTPEIASDEVLVKVACASLCGTDQKILSQKFFPGGKPPSPAYTPGHEYAGTVVRLGSSVKEFRVGDRVVTEAHRGCMRCPNCLNGHYTECLNFGDTDVGHRGLGMTVDGGFAQYVANPVSTLTLLPDDVPFDDAVTLTTAGTVLHAYGTLEQPLAGSSVAVLGLGPIGLLAVQVARALGAGRILAAGRRDVRLKLASRYGADEVINLAAAGAATDLTAAAERLAGPHGFDSVLECAGSESTTQAALSLAKRGGEVVLVGFYDGPVTVDLNRAVMNAVQIHSVRGEGSGSVRRAVALAETGKLSGREMITHRVPLADITEAFRILTDRSQGAVKVMIDVAGEVPAE
jgi:2-desacetyl-2-hydroxyethyl bacteriochlorophyllide A dehydrogenase